ncbi:MAG: family 78 glycoside hydrolase catalytic domain [Candidatus Hydrogenedens sp.]|nr:family 78 glycoside hydrolase catalytic domain [Candidatus Hydrogenedens sp.]
MTQHFFLSQKSSTLRKIFLFLLLLTGQLVASATATAEPALQHAPWLRDPIFRGHAVQNLFHREKDPKPELSGPQHVHTLFRREIKLAEKPLKAFLLITADDYFKFYINDHFALQGPAPAYYSAHPCLEIEVTPFLEEGVNTLAAHVYYQGLYNRVWNSGDNRSGFALLLRLEYADGRAEQLMADESWRCHRLQAFLPGDTIGYRTQFLENIDMRLMPRGWREQDFDDSAWERPFIEAQDHVFEHQITAPLQVTVWKPKVTENRKKGIWFYDFGQTVVGTTRIRIHGKKGHTLIVRHGEELQENGEVRFDMRANCRYEEKCILSGEKDLIEFYDYRSFRYLEIHGAPEEPEVWVDVRHHPFNEKAVEFRSDSQLLQDIWQLCQRGVVMGAQEVFVDCPSREKGQYLGDTLIAARSHMWLTGDMSLANQALRDFTHSVFIHPGLMAVAPGSFMQEIAEYSLQFPLLLMHYYQLSGDLETVKIAADTVFEGLFDYFQSFENEKGLLAGISKESGKWLLVDWPENLRDNYDYEYSLKAGNTVLNAFYYGALRTAAEFERIFGRIGKTYDDRADRLEAAFEQHLANPQTGLYLDAPGSEHSSLHANAVPLFFNLTAGADRKAILELIAEKELICGVYMASFVIEACFKAGAPDLAFSLITSTGEHSWNEMLRHGATTCMEAWGPDQKWNTSWLHPWSSSPIYLLAQYVFGLSPAEPGWKRIRIAPPAISNLPAMSIRLPLPDGQEISAIHDTEKGYKFMTPPGIPVDRDGEQNNAFGKDNQLLNRGLSPDRLAQARWTERVQQGPGLWVSVAEQRLHVLEGEKVIMTMPCATALKGIGAVINSLQTPPGWHQISGKLGDGEPAGRVFRARQATEELWKPGMKSKEDLVLTRIFLMQGLEPGINQGKNSQGQIVDSKQRFIYIHGTNHEEQLGIPTSQGCIRLANDDVIRLFELIPEGTLLYIEP